MSNILDTIERNPAGFAQEFTDWNEEMMEAMAEEMGIELTEEMKGYVVKAREMYEQNQTVPPIRVFSKELGGDRKGSVITKMFNGGPMKKIAQLGFLPQPTGCV